MDYAAIVAADRRLVILRALKEDAGYSHNESILQDILGMFGHRVGRDQVKTLISWLAEQGLVTVEMVGDYMVATLTARGADVAAGNVVVPGVKRPGPKG